MGYKINKGNFDNLIKQLEGQYTFFGPRLIKGGGSFSDTDSIQYREITSIGDIEFEEKAMYSFKEILLPITQTLFYFTEDRAMKPKSPEKGAVVFLRSCDLHSIKRLDQIYLESSVPDIYYEEIRSRIKFILMGCNHSFENCFCVEMGTNRATFYDAYVNPEKDIYLVDSKWDTLTELLATFETAPVSPTYVKENALSVQLPEFIPAEVMSSDFWDQYDSRCIACGRCNFVCPTCTCFTMQDIFYQDNSQVGERRRVHASCMVDGYTDMAGGHSFRQKHGQRMRFKVLHKIQDHHKRFGCHMCVGCGRCDDVCPEYISYTNIINHLNKGEEK